MADFGSAPVKDVTTSVVAVEETVPVEHLHTEFDYGSAPLHIADSAGPCDPEIIEVVVIEYQQPPPSNADPGDHITQLVKDLDIPEPRSSIYMVGSNVRTVVKYFRLHNLSAESRTVTVWVGGIPVKEDLVLAAGETHHEKDIWLVMYPAEQIEVQCSGVDVAVEFSGIEEVSAAA